MLPMLDGRTLSVEKREPGSDLGPVPFALEEITATPAPSDGKPVKLRYNVERQRNEVDVDGQWVDVVEAAEHLESNPLLVGTHGATMTEVVDGSGRKAYKLDDDH